MLFSTPQAARSIKRGTLDMRVCFECGFVFNSDFDSSLVDYGPAYENSQDCSPAFNAHLDELVDYLVTKNGVRNGRVVEVGCGKGVFLNKLLAHPDNHSDAVGFDPSYLGEVHVGRVKFVKDFYGPDTAVPADVVVCRHVIEHIPDPVELLRTVRAGVGESGTTQVFFETPCVEWILRNRVPWDFFYEHCSLFTAASLALALARAGFVVSAVRHVFGGQYLWAEASTGGKGSEFQRNPLTRNRSGSDLSPRYGGEVLVAGELEMPMKATNHTHLSPIPGGEVAERHEVSEAGEGVFLPHLSRLPPKTIHLAHAFIAQERERLLRWGALLAHLATRGEVFVWGAGAKGVTFCNLADPDRSRVTAVVDVNPAKQGKFLPGTGHAIVSPADAKNAAAVLVLNPNYFAEVRATVERLGFQAGVIDLMQEAIPCGS
jgi:hypothetical protein